MRTLIPLTDGWQLADVTASRGDGPAGVLAGSDAFDWQAAALPVSVHAWLLEAGRISDPAVSSNAAESAWVGDHDWAFRTGFRTPETAGGPVVLRLDEIDTVGTVFLNGVEILSSRDMYRRYRVEVTEVLAPAGQVNELVVVILSPAVAVDGIERPPHHGDRIAPNRYLRKGAGDFASYLGARPRFLKVGLGRVWLDCQDSAAIADLRVRTRLEEGSARIDVDPTVHGASSAIDWELVAPDGMSTRGSRDGTGPWSIAVSSPQLWWPRSHGASPLYRLKLELRSADGIVVDRRETVLGLRSIELETRDPDSGEPLFRLVVNGVPVYARGANWANLEGISNRWDADRAARLFTLAEAADMNTLRVWGGGYEPDEEFYAECDRRGFLVWQDFMFEYHMYPADVPGFLEDVRAEVIGTVERLRDHACIALWCGGNEMQMGWEFEFGSDAKLGEDLFTRVIPELVDEYDGSRGYHPGSPYGGPLANSPEAGDWHDYTTLTWSHGTSVPTFVSEIGRVSAPSLRSMKRFLPSDDELWPEGHDASVRAPGEPSWPAMWGYRAPDGAWDKVGPLERYLEPRSAEELIRSLGTAHGEYLAERAERHRRGRPDGDPAGPRRNWGNLVWRLNDPWPILYWSVVDSYLQPKIPYYFLRRAYAPVLVSFEETPDQVHVWVTNDTSEPVAGDLVLRREGFDGTVHAQLEQGVLVGPGESLRVLDAAPLGAVVRRSQLLHAELAGTHVVRLFQSERYLHLGTAALAVDATAAGLVVRSDRFVRDVRIELDSDEVHPRDDRFDLPANVSHTVRTTGAYRGPVTVSALNAAAVSLDVDIAAPDGGDRP